MGSSSGRYLQPSRNLVRISSSSVHSSGPTRGQLEAAAEGLRLSDGNATEWPAGGGAAALQWYFSRMLASERSQIQGWLGRSEVIMMVA